MKGYFIETNKEKPKVKFVKKEEDRRELRERRRKERRENHDDKNHISQKEK